MPHSLQALLTVYSDKACSAVMVKPLSPNDNSKNQVYFGSDFTSLNVIPIQDIQSDNSGSWKHARFKTKVNFYWLTDDGAITRAPEAQLILYPDYPEVRFSGFLRMSCG